MNHFDSEVKSQSIENIQDELSEQPHFRQYTMKLGQVDIKSSACHSVNHFFDNEKATDEITEEDENEEDVESNGFRVSSTNKGSYINSRCFTSEKKANETDS